MTHAKTKVLIVSPVLNEEALLPEFLSQFLELENSSPEGEFRLLAVDDGSTDRSPSILKDFSSRHPDKIAFVSFASNFGYQSALIAGLERAGEWADLYITMDSDLEHPMAVVKEMVRIYREKKPLKIEAIRREHKDLGIAKRLFSRLFYKVASLLTGLRISAGQADFQAWDAQVIHSIRPKLNTLHSLRLFSSFFSGRKEVLVFDQHLQKGRTSRFTFGKNVRMAMMGILRFSDRPFALFAWAAGGGLLFSLAYGIYTLIIVLKGGAVLGWASMIMTVLFFGSLQLLSIALMGFYVKYLIIDKDLPVPIVHQQCLFK